MFRHLGLMLAVATVLAGAESRAEEIRLGFASALSGPYAATGTRYHEAVEVAVERLNRNGGMLGQPVRVITADDACDVEQAEAAAHELVAAGVSLVIGHLCSHSSLVAAAIYEQAGVPMLTTTASHPRLTEEGRGNVFRLIGRDDRQGQIAADFLAERWSRGKIAILSDGSTYGAGLADQTRRRLRERGVSEALDASYPPGADDYADLVDKMQRAGIEVAYVGGYGPDAARIVRTARQRGDDVQLIGGHGLGMPEFWSVAGKAGAGTIFTGRRDIGLGAEAAPAAAALRAHGVEPVPGSLAAYAAVEAWAEAVKRAGSPAPAAVIKALHKGKFATVLGWVGFDGKGDLEGGDWQWQVWRDNGQYEVVKGALARIK